MQAVKEKVEEFVTGLQKEKSLYGWKEETLYSLLLSVLPAHNHKYVPYSPKPIDDFTTKSEILVTSLQYILQALVNNAGFRIQNPSLEELQSDCEYIYPIICKDSQFHELLQKANWDEEQVLKAIQETMNTLHTAPHSLQCLNDDKSLAMSPLACMMLSLMVQWLIRYFCKCIIQVLNPVALSIHNEIVATYKRHYLTSQSHFCLKSLVKHYQVQLTLNDASCPTKLLCYTRPSSALFKIPASFSGSEEGNTEIIIKEFIHDAADCVRLLKLANMTSEKNVVDALNTFMETETATVFVLIANTHYIPLKTVNHIRIMIEEVENTAKVHNKLFVFILQFSHRFSKYSYPTLYLHGWSHIYLESITPIHHVGGVNIHEWFVQSYCTTSKKSIEEDSLYKCLLDMLPQSIPSISAAVRFGQHNNVPFNTKLTPGQRNKLLCELLVENVVGKALCTSFRRCITSSLMANIVDQAAIISQRQDSTLSMADQIHLLFSSMFLDYMTLMVAKVNENCNIDTFFEKSSSPAFRNLFADLTILVSPPKVKWTSMKALVNALQVPVTPTVWPKFPFFYKVMERMELLIEETQKCFHDKIVLFDGEVPDPYIDSCTVSTLTKKAIERIQNEEKNETWKCLHICWIAMKLNPELWMKYFNDLMTYKLHLKSSSLQFGGIMKRLFEQNVECSPRDKMVHIHAYFALYGQHLANIATSLRPLEALDQQITGSLSEFTLDTKQDGIIHYQVTSFLINTLFNFFCLCNSHTSPEDAKKLEKWYEVYKNIMAMPLVSKCIYDDFSTASSEEVRLHLEGKYNVMQAIFVMLQCKPFCDDDLIVIAVNILNDFRYEGFLTSPYKVYPDLAQIVKILAVHLKAKDTRFCQKVFDGLFSHFLCNVSRTDFPHVIKNEETDCLFFMELMNEQTQWMQVIESSESKKEFTVPKLSMNVCKLYLSRILVSGSTKHFAAPLGLFNHKRRLYVASVLLQEPNLPPLDYFIPLHYYQCSTEMAKPQNLRMMQPLAHLYFVTTMECFTESCKEKSVSDIIGIMKQITNELENQNEDKIVLFIELQAAIQLSIQHLAPHLDPDNPRLIGSLSEIIDRIDQILNDVNTSGCGGHILLLLMHLLDRLGEEKLVILFQQRFDTICKNITSLEHTKDVLKNYVPSLKNHPYVSALFEKDDKVLYDRVNNAMHHSDESQLIVIANECSSQQSASYPKGCFRMVIWLVTYFEFYIPNKTAKKLSESFEKSELSKHFERGQIRLIQCFLNPDVMLNKPELSNVALDTRGPSEIAPDPLHTMFAGKMEGSHHLLALLVATIMRCPPNSNHLWSHLFAPELLPDTFMTGFMKPNIKVNANPFHYDCGIILLNNGKLNETIYNEYTTRGAYTMPSLYSLLWTNIGAFCIALLTQPDADTKLHGPIISKWLPLRHYCLAKLNEISLLIKSKLDISEEVFTLLMMSCMKKLCELSLNPIKAPLKATYCSANEVDEFERLWHSKIYELSLEAAKKEVSDHCSQFSLLKNARLLKKNYPAFYTTEEICNIVMNDMHYHPNQTFLLKTFIQNRTVLEAGGQLLPVLLRFYQWLHKDLAYAITKQEAREHSIKEIVDIFSDQVTENLEQGANDVAELPMLTVPHNAYNDLKLLYETLKEKYNRYVEILGGMIGEGACNVAHAENRLEKMHDECLISDFLSEQEMEGVENDWLYIVISDIVNRHNTFIDALYHRVRAEKICTVGYCLPSEPHEIPITEYTKHHCIVHNSATSLCGIHLFEQLARSRSSTPSIDAQTNTSIAPQIDLVLLQDDIVKNFCVGKPLLESPSTIRVCYKFKSLTTEHHIDPASVLGSSDDIHDLQCKLPAELKATLNSADEKTFEVEFHSATYHTLIEAARILRNVLGHLKQETSTGKLDTNVLVCKFLDSSDAFTTNQSLLTAKQAQYLANLRISMAFACFTKFLAWINDGMYNFHSLPLSFKEQLLLTDHNTIKNIPSLWKGDISTLREELQSMAEVLDQIQSTITSVSPETPIMKYLKDLQMIEDKDKIPLLLPDSIQMKHYASFKLALKQLHSDTEMNDGDMNAWKGDVTDIWGKWLPHLRDTKRDYEAKDNMIYSSEVGVQKKPQSEIDHQDGHSKQTISSVIVIEPSEAKSAVSLVSSTTKLPGDKAYRICYPDLLKGITNQETLIAELYAEEIFTDEERDSLEGLDTKDQKKQLLKTFEKHLKEKPELFYDLLRILENEDGMLARTLTEKIQSKGHPNT